MMKPYPKLNDTHHQFLNPKTVGGGLEGHIRRQRQTEVRFAPVMVTSFWNVSSLFSTPLFLTLYFYTT